VHEAGPEVGLFGKNSGDAPSGWLLARKSAISILQEARFGVRVLSGLFQRFL
jgi:hypothetical protein